MHKRTPPGSPEIPIGIHQEIIRIEAIQCSDLIYLRYGVEERDIMPSMIKQELLNDTELREIVQDYHKMFMSFLEQKKI